MAIAALRYNNPGNVSLPIRGYDGPGEIVGIKGQAGYASFPTMADGLRAQTARLTSYLDRGVNGSGPLTSIAALNSRYAEDPNWKNAVARFSGIGVNDRIDSSNPQQVAALQGAIIRQETGKDPSVFGFGAGSVANGNSLTAPGTANGGMFSGVETSAGSNITGFKQNADGSADVTLGFDEGGAGQGFGSGSAQTTGFDSTGGFTGANVAGGASSGAFGLGGVNSGGQTVASGLGASGTGNPNGYSLDGATLDPGVSASSVADPIVGYNAAGPVMGAPTVTAAINTSGQKVSGSVDKGAKQIGDDTKKAGETIGKSVDTFGQTVSKLSSSWQDYFGETFLRLAFIVVGLVLFAAALWYLARPQVQAVAGAVADVIPAGRVAKVATGLARRAKRG